MAIRGKRTKRAQGRGHSDPPQPSTSIGVKNDRKRIQKKEPVKGFDALSNKQKSAPFNFEQNDEDNGYNDGEDGEMQLIMEEIHQRQLLKQQAADANNAKKCIEATFGLSNNVRPSSGRSHVETDRQKVISVEGISNSGRRITRGQGRGRSDLPDPSQYCIDPTPQPIHTSVSPGVKNGKNKTQKKGRGKRVNTLNNKLKSTAFNPEKNDEHCDNNDGEDEELQHIIEKICQSQSHKQQATDANNVENYIGSSFGLSNNARSPSVGYNVETDTRTVKSVEGISNPGRGVKRGLGKDYRDPQRPSQSCIDSPPQPAHTSVIPGVKKDKNRIHKKGRGKKVNTLNKKQKSIAFNSEQNDEHDDNNDGEDEDLELIPEKSIQPRMHKQHATNANNVERHIGSDFGLNNVRSSSVGYHVENNTRKVISVEGISNPGRGIRRCQGRGCSDPPGPSQSCIDPPPPPPAHTSVFSGFQNVYNRAQRKGLLKGVGALNNKQKATAFSSEHNDEYYDDSDGEDEEMQLIIEKIYQRQLLKHQAAIANNVKKSIGARFGLSNNVRPSRGGSHIEADRRKVVSIEGIYNAGRGTKRGRGIGRSDPPGPSQSCIDPSPPPATHNSVSPGAAADYSSWQNAHATIYGRGDTSAIMGMRNDMNKMQKKVPVKGIDALNNKQKFTAVSSEENDEYSDYDDGEDEEMQLMGEKVIEQQSLRQQVADTNNVKQYNGGNSGVSNHGSMGSASSDSVPHSTDSPAKDPTSLPLRRSSVEIDRRKVISIEDNPNPRRFVPQSVTRDIISTVIARMPIPAAKWREYPIEMKDELFKDFMGKYKFASDSECSIARMVWERTCLDRYPDHLKNARKVALRHVNSTNLADTKGHGPKGLKPEVWDGLVDIWLKPEWTKRSDANRCNRASKPDSVLHTGGSISFTEHKKRLEEELKQGVSYRDVYAHVHKRKDGEYVSRRSEKFIELYDTVMLEKYGEDSSNHPVFDSKVWAEVSGMNKNKRRSYEGRSYDVDTPGPMPISYPQDIGPSRTAAQTEEYIKEAVNTAMASFVQTQLAPMLQPILSMIGGSIRQALSQGRVADRDGEDE